MPTIRSFSDLEQTPHVNVFPTSEPKTIRLELEVSEAVDPHSYPGHDITHFDGDQAIPPRAIEPSTALIVLAQQESA